MRVGDLRMAGEYVRASRTAIRRAQMLAARNCTCGRKCAFASHGIITVPESHGHANSSQPAAKIATAGQNSSSPASASSPNGLAPGKPLVPAASEARQATGRIVVLRSSAARAIWLDEPASIPPCGRAAASGLIAREQPVLYCAEASLAVGASSYGATVLPPPPLNQAGWLWTSTTLLMRSVRAAPADRPFVVAQLGQSLDGRIATPTGESRWINQSSALDHVHRLRATVDARRGRRRHRGGGRSAAQRAPRRRAAIPCASSSIHRARCPANAKVFNATTACAASSSARRRRTARCRTASR